MKSYKITFVRCNNNFPIKSFDSFIWGTRVLTRIHEANSQKEAMADFYGIWKIVKIISIKKVK
jgi:hypothetical protein